ncbi:MAG: heavy-metal-associated domain-containing protein [Chloroflexota bacterium]|nr:heavy-metal-associated domain-containing protein [Chloroflexota bacterium]
MSITEQATFTAPDISCGHCVSRVQAAVGALNGVDTVVADIDTKRVDVTYDAAVTSPAVISAALAEAGYPAAE